LANSTCIASLQLAANAWGVGREKIAAALAVSKRAPSREVRGEVNGITVIDDFAPSPHSGARNPGRASSQIQRPAVDCSLEPRSRTSSHSTFQQQYVAAFTPADYVIVSRVYDAQRAAEMGGVLDIEKLIEDISAQNKPASAITEVDEIVSQLKIELRSGDVVAIMSNGAFGGIHEKLLAALSEPPAVAGG
jgi:UDP-N-acetylmuramate: L-alanyl-gamma-D-glutamyl-meso-diaminopimelate ligase